MSSMTRSIQRKVIYEKSRNRIDFRVKWRKFKNKLKKENEIAE